MWDSISHDVYGDSKYADALIEANARFATVYRFSAGISLMLPDIDKTVSASDLPPWRRVSG